MAIITKEQIARTKIIARKWNTLHESAPADNEQQKTEVEQEIQKSKVINIDSIRTDEDHRTICFTVPGSPVGKPRMTQRDRWMKRTAVVNYRHYCDRIRSSTGPLPPNADGVRVVAHLAVSASWSQKKKHKMIGLPHRQKPDGDNILKSVCDALFTEDSGLWKKHVEKYWCAEGDERTEIAVLYCNQQSK